MASDDLQRQQQVLHLLERVGEPLSIPKSNGTVFFNLPEEYVPTEYRGLVNFVDDGEEVTARFGPTEDVVRPKFVFNIDSVTVPDLSAVKVVPRGIPFSYFIKVHKEAAEALISIFDATKSYDEFLSLAALVRDQVNEQLFVHAFSSYVINYRKPGIKRMRLPAVWEVLPEKFFETDVIRKAQTAVNTAVTLRAPQTERIVINRSFASTDRNPENRLSYFREDMGINSHHWHWHLVYRDTGRARDRHGEMFYYMHQQMLTRYELERMANFLPRTKPLPELDWSDEVISEGYFPKLTASNSGLNWGSRPPGLRLQNVDIPEPGFELSINIRDLKIFTSRILHAIHSGFAENDKGVKVPLDSVTGIDILSQMIESSSRSINRLFYGNLHNLGHMLMAFIHDPEHAHMENMGVIGDGAASMRDPLFYRWHKFIDELFQQFKATLQPYKKEELTYPGVTVKSVEVVGSKGNKNILNTGWQESDIELTRGLAFGTTNPVFARVTHLQHESFSYSITVDNATQKPQQVTFRIFLGPTKDLSTGRNFALKEQRPLMIEMDKFVKKVPPGQSTIRRESSASSVTIPFEQTFRQLERITKPAAAPGVLPDGPTDEEINYCGCGWPDHMLLPRGSPGTGTEFTLFVMATNWENDRVDTPPTAEKKKTCRNAASFCGVLDEKYPDKKSMGYPFDRPADSRTVRTLGDFLTPNMKTTDIRIIFEDKVIKRFP